MKFVINILLIVLFALPAHLSANSKDIELGKRFLKLGNTYREAGDFQNASKYLNDGRVLLQGSRTWDSRYWQAVAHEFLGFMYRDMNMPEAAKTEFSSALAKYSRLISQSDGSPYAVDLVIQGINNISKQTTGKLQQVVTGWDAEPFQQVSEYINSNNFREALFTLNKIIENEPDNALAYYMRGIVHNKLGNTTESEADFNMAFTLNSAFIPPSGITNPIIYDSLEDALKEPDKVQFLNLESQGFTDFPMDRLRRFPNLVSLNLRYNAIENIPRNISDLQNLQVLILDANPLSANSIPDEIGNLKKLKQLSLRYVYLEPNDVVKLCKKLPEETRIVF